MRLLLVHPPISRYDSAEISPPLSLLKLAQAARHRGVEVSVLDLNLSPHREMADHADLYSSYVLELVARSGADEVGITSMGVNSHLAISLANLIHDHLGVHVVLGGVHLSSISDVVRALCPNLGYLATPSLRVSPESRSEWWASNQSKAADASADVRDLFSAVDLHKYFAANPRRVANMETGSGCKYNCSFCYSPTVHSTWFNQAPDEVVSSFKALYDLGFAHVFLVQDNLFNDHSWIENLAKQLSRCNLAVTWNGYATLPDLNPSIFPLLAEAGCQNLYIGVDSVDRAQQKSWNKRVLRESAPILDLVRAGSSVGLTLTCAFIIDPHPAARGATFSALRLALRLRSFGADIRLSVLTPYPGTKFFHSECLEYSEDRVALLMDLPEVVVRNSYASFFIDAFPWHSKPNFAKDWQAFLLAVNAAQSLLNSNYEVISAFFDFTGDQFWGHCLNIAAEILLLDEVHKTELGEAISLANRGLKVKDIKESLECV
jgi:hypothetical protein